LSEDKGLLASLLKSLSGIEKNEIRATSVSFAFVFTLMVAYYLLRPVRDAMASDWTDAELSTLWTINFFVSTGIVALYGIAVSRIPFRALVPAVYGFFAASFIAFYFLESFIGRAMLDKIFYLWVSVFALFHVSVFWSFMADIFSKDQAGRLFSIIAAGASLGAIVGPLLSGVLAQFMNVESMILIAAFILLLPVPLIYYLDHMGRTQLGNISQGATAVNAIGGNPLSGFREFVSNPYLLGIGIFIILYTGIGSFVYFEQKNLLAQYDRETRTMIYGYRDALVNTLTYLLAFFVTGRLVTRVGMPVALAIVPLVLVFGMLVLAFSPVLLVAVGMHVVAKAGNYGVTRPAREVLFTLVDREDRFKTKPVIDIVAYRGGDVIMGWLFTGLSQGVGMGMAGIAVVGAGIAALWAAVGLLLGRSYNRRQEEQDQ
jgi:ATP:ADP antiporter, AAA family